MRRLGILGWLTLVLVSAGTTGCGKSDNNPSPDAAALPPAANLAVAGPTVAPPSPSAATVPAAQGRYDAALGEALTLLAERRYPEALSALEAARRLQDTEQVRREIASCASASTVRPRPSAPWPTFSSC
jgi:hypothetical protein